MSTVRSAEKLEPRLVVRWRAKPYFLRRRFVWSFGPAVVSFLDDKHLNFDRR